MKKLKKRLYVLIWGAMLISWIMIWSQNVVLSAAPEFDTVATQITSDGSVLTTWVGKNRTLRQNIFDLFYPGDDKWKNQIFKVVRDVTLGVMVIFIVMAGASLLINRDSKESNKWLKSLLYIMLWWIFIYIASRLFGSVFNFSGAGGIVDGGEWGIWWVTNKLIWDNSVLFKVLSAVKAAAFFLAIIMIVVTWFKVISAWDGEKWKS